MTASRPLIGVAWPKADYVASLERAGADVRELTPSTDPPAAAVAACDGLLLTGGPDVDPAEYGDPERHPALELAADRDAYELALARLALARDVPLLAICRGAQVLNVAAGGTLIQDLPTQRAGPVAHTVSTSGTALAHEVTVAPGTRLATLLGARTTEGRLSVNSRHHQAVKAVARGFVVSAVAPDGVIEAIEAPRARFCVAVQWHPENFWPTGEFATLFDGLVAAARSGRDRR